MMSAHDTMPGQMASTCFLMSSTISKPLSVRLGTASRSALLPGVEAINTDASQPCKENNPLSLIPFNNLNFQYQQGMAKTIDLNGGKPVP
jgi:hypothetical protein